MKFLKPVIIGIVAISAFSLNAQEEITHKLQDKRIAKREIHLAEIKTPETSAKKKADELATKLTNVTDEQRDQMEALFLKVAQKIEAVKENTNLTDDQKTEFIQGNKNNEQNALRMILTDDQNAELEVLRG